MPQWSPGTAVIMDQRTGSRVAPAVSVVRATHASLPALGKSHSSRPSIGMLWVAIARPTPVGRHNGFWQRERQAMAMGGGGSRAFASLPSATRLAKTGTCKRDLARFQARDDEPTGCSSGVDQLLGGQARPRPQVSEVPFHGAGPDAHELGGVRDRSASGNVGSQDVHLALRCLRPRHAA